jgi:hypothetical protein
MTEVAACDGGRECTSPCELNPCDENAECVPLDGGRFSCECKYGVDGNNYKKALVTPSSSSSFDACTSCGPNTKCLIDGGVLCSCLDGFVGPNCREQCSFDLDCPGDQKCVDNLCTDPCLTKACGEDEKCEVVSRSAVCMRQCAAGLRSDARRRCVVNRSELFFCHRC